MSQINNAWDDHHKSSNKMFDINPAKKYRQDLLDKFVQQIIGNKQQNKLIDIGSGLGDVLAYFYTKNPTLEMLGLEYSREGVEFAKKMLPNATFLQADLTQTQNNEKYREWANVAICSEVLEHIDDPKKFLDNVAYYLQKNATIIITMPAGIMNEFEKHIGHRKHYTKTELEKLLLDSGYKNIKIYQAGFPFFNFYKILGFLRGKKLIADAGTYNHNQPSFLVRVFSRLLLPLMKINLTNSRWGWQLVAMANNVEKIYAKNDV